MKNKVEEIKEALRQLIIAAEESLIESWNPKDIEKTRRWLARQAEKEERKQGRFDESNH